jgi:hypothetical protein
MLNDSQLAFTISPGRAIVSKPDNNVDEKGELLADKKQLLKDYITDLYSIIAGDMQSAQTYAKISQDAQKIVDLDAALLKSAVTADQFNRHPPSYDTEEKTRLEDLKSLIPIVSFFGI